MSVFCMDKGSGLNLLLDLIESVFCKMDLMVGGSIWVKDTTQQLPVRSCLRFGSLDNPLNTPDLITVNEAFPFVSLSITPLNPLN